MSSLDRSEQCFERMKEAGFDVLVLGRDAHALAMTGTRRLTLSGTRPFGPSCIVVAAARTVTAAPVTWSPANVVEWLQSCAAPSTVRRVGVDGMTPGVGLLLRGAWPDATFEDAGPLLRALVQMKTPEELDALRAAASVAVAAFGEMVAALRTGATSAELRGVFAAAAASHGVTTPAFEAVAAPLGGSTWLPAPDGRLSIDDTVVLRGGVLRQGWEASLARTYRDGRECAPAGWDDAVRALRPGARVGDVAVAHGVGRGIERLGPDEHLEPGMVVAVEVADDTALRQDVFAIRDGDPELLTSTD
jgi:Xaa-Pro aminopeptidase